MTTQEETRRLVLITASERAGALTAGLGAGIEVLGTYGPSAAVVCAFYGVRTSRLLSAVALLCRSSFGVESQSLLRSMLQDVADVRYIATDPVALCEQWRQHGSRRRYYAYKMVTDDPQGTDIPCDFEDLERLIEADWAEARRIAAEKTQQDIKKVSKTKAGRYLLKDRWTRKTIRQAAEIANAKYPDTLDLFRGYQYLCEHTHGSPGLASDYLVKHDSRLCVRDRHDAAFKSASMALQALVFAHATLGALSDIGLKYDPAPLIDALPQGWDCSDL
ncbi:MAG: hypothetical protein HGA39_01420 [Coriobacteriia bacterium]|nr:hypothetical protein [Coriobacteriia bacterium]